MRAAVRAVRALTSVCLIAAIAGCADPAARLREMTYPPDFNYLPPERLRSIMWKLAAQVAEVNRLLHDPAPSANGTQEAVVAALSAMEAVAFQLGPAGLQSNHPRVSDNAERFQRDVSAALAAARRDPPNYFLAGTLSGACAWCHGN